MGDVEAAGIGRTLSQEFVRDEASSDRLQFYRDEVKRSKRGVRRSYDDGWKRYIDLYRGKQYEHGRCPTTKLIVNLIFATINVIAPAVAVNNPRFVVNARNPENAPQAVITEEVLNYLWRHHNYQDEFRLAVNDWLVFGHGWFKVGYKFIKPPEEKKADGVERRHADRCRRRRGHRRP